MSTAYSTLLGLALPVTSELAGTWGDTVNNYITQYLDSAVAGTQTLSTDADVTLTKTTGTSLGATSSQYAIINCTGARTALRTITAPAASKIYIVINATTGGYSVKLVGVGPTTGVTIVAGESATVAWNGSDFIKISNTAGAGSFTSLTATGAVTFSTATDNLALGTSQTSGTWTAGGAAQTGTLTLDQSTKAHTLNLGTGATENATTKTINLGTAGVSGSTTTINIGSAVSGATNSITINGNPTLSAGTANGVLYLNGSKVATSGSALSFNGSQFDIGVGAYYGKLNVGRDTSAPYATVMMGDNTTPTNSVGLYFRQTSGAAGISTAGSDFAFFLGGPGVSEQMRLNSTGLGIGTISPAAKLDVRSAIGTTVDGSQNINAIDTTAYALGNGGGISFGYVYNSGGSVIGRAAVIKGIKENATDGNYATALTFSTTANSASTTEKMRLDSSGNLGLGVTPSAWISTAKAIEFVYPTMGMSNSGAAFFSFNAYLNSAGNWIYKSTDEANRFVADIDSSFKWFQAASGTAGNAITFTQAMTLTAAGFLGVGTTNPAYGLVVSDAGAAGLEFAPGTQYSAGKCLVQAYNRSTSAYVQLDHSASVHTWQIGSTEKMQLDASGNLLVGTTSTNAGAKLDVKGVDSTSSNYCMYFENSSAALLLAVQNDGRWRSGTAAASPYNYVVGGTNRDLYVQDNGDIGYVSSVRASKTNIAPVSNVDWLLRLNPVTFNFRKKDTEGNYTEEADGPLKHGLIAEEVEAVNPDLCFYDDADQGGALRGVNYTHLITPMLKLIQEQQALITALTARVAALESK